MFTLGGTELLLLGVLALLLFGPDKIPQLARTLGRAMREFNKYKDIMESAFRVEMEAAEKRDAVQKASASSEEETDGLDKLKQAAAASREFAAEHGTEVPDVSEAFRPVKPKPSGEEGEPESAETPELPATATDEDEEEG